MTDYSVFQGKKAAFYTLGCKLNFAETSTFAEQLGKFGVSTARKGEQADICIINTCSVTEVADHKCRQQINKMVRTHPNAFVLVTGCYAQLSSSKVAEIPGVDIVLGANEKARLVEILADKMSGRIHDKILCERVKDIRSFAASCSRGNRTRYFLKVQDGCNYYCTYCTIPFARGNSRNASISSLVSQAEAAAQCGAKEIVITGVNIGDFGQTTGESFLDLVRELDRVEGIQRYRISSIEPNLLTKELIDFCAQSRSFMPHFHIPLQSGSDEVLRLMHRRYDTAFFRHKIEYIKEMMPDAFIGVDVMVGCRGETEDCFEECYNFINSLDVQQLHVFPYSERPGTQALNIPHIVADKDRKERSQRLIQLSEEKFEAFYSQHIGCEMEVLVERAQRNKPMTGFTPNYIRVELPADMSHEEYDNHILRVRLGGFNDERNALKGELL